MTSRSCYEALVGVDYWLPIEPFDYAWDVFGCNQLRCGNCGEAVSSTLMSSKTGRFYHCRCRSREEYGLHVLGSDDGRDWAFESRWSCSGHPPLPLPLVLDGVTISDLGSWSSVVGQTLSNPPFLAPGFSRPSFWVERLFHLVPTDAQRREIANAVLGQVGSDDAMQISAALSFFTEIPAAPGASELMSVAVRDADRLRDLRDPRRPQSTLYERMLDAVVSRLDVRDVVGKSFDEDALVLLQGAALGGETRPDMLSQLSSRSPRWLCQHAVDLVRVQPRNVVYVRFALREGPPSKLEEAKDALMAVEALME